MDDRVAATFEHLRSALQELMDLGRAGLDDARRAMVATAASAPGETEYVIVINMRQGMQLDGAAHIVKSLPDEPKIVSPVFAFRDGLIGPAVVSDGDGSPKKWLN